MAQQAVTAWMSNIPIVGNWAPFIVEPHFVQKLLSIDGILSGPLNLPESVMHGAEALLINR